MGCGKHAGMKRAFGILKSRGNERGLQFRTIKNGARD
jgi:hypothetical protein